MEQSTQDRIWQERAWALARVLLSVASILAGLALVLIAVVVGDCSAFGGSCPAEAPPLWDDDTLRFAALGAALAVGPPIFLSRPTLRRLLIALGAAAGAAVAVGLMARSIASA